MTKVVEKILKSTIVREIAGIQSAIILENKGTYYIQTEGVNFNILKDLDFINLNTVGSNDINAISLKFGVIYFLCLDLSSQKCNDQGNRHTFWGLRSLC